jgi:hypothetical protein
MHVDVNGTVHGVSLVIATGSAGNTIAFEDARFKANHRLDGNQVDMVD